VIDVVFVQEKEEREMEEKAREKQLLEEMRRKELVRSLVVVVSLRSDSKWVMFCY